MKKKIIKINFYLTFNIIGVGQSHSPSNPPHFDFKSLAVPSSFGRSVNLFHPTRAMCSLFLSERYFRKHLCRLKKDINSFRRSPLQFAQEKGAESKTKVDMLVRYINI